MSGTKTGTTALKTAVALIAGAAVAQGEEPVIEPLEPPDAIVLSNVPCIALPEEANADFICNSPIGYLVVENDKPILLCQEFGKSATEIFLSDCIEVTGEAQDSQWQDPAVRPWQPPEVQI